MKNNLLHTDIKDLKQENVTDLKQDKISLGKFYTKQNIEMFCLFSVFAKSLFLENRLFVKTDPVFVKSLEILCFLGKKSVFILLYYKKQKLFPVYFSQC